MIYLDVTSACRSSLNTGVKRIQRGMHSSLKNRPDYLPICWQSALQGYRTLHAGEISKLERPGSPSGLALFDSFAPGAFADGLHYFRDRSTLLNLQSALASEDLLLLPDLLWDNRGGYVAQLRGTPARRIGIFHDAIALRHNQSRIDGHFCRRGIRALAGLDGVLCISCEAESDLHFYWGEDKLAYVPTKAAPWPVPFGDSRPATTSNFSAHRLLYVARLEPHKNHLRLLAACELLWQQGLSFHLDLIGCFAYPAAAWQITRRIRALQRKGRSVSWRAHVDDSQLHEAYQKCSATAFPSLLEGFGLPVIESLWHGRPVICGANGALGELARDGGCETVDTLDVSSFAYGMRRVLTDEAHYQSLFKAAVARRFRTWADYWREVDEFCGGRFTTASPLSKSPDRQS